MDRADNFKKYIDRLGVREDVLAGALESIAINLTPEERIERKISKVRQRPSIYRDAVESGLPLPKYEGDDLLFSAKEEALALAVNIRNFPKGVDLLRYYNGAEKFNEKYVGLSPEEIMAHASQPEIEFLKKFKNYLMAEKRPELVSPDDMPDAFMEGFAQGFMREEKYGDL